VDLGLLDEDMAGKREKEGGGEEGDRRMEKEIVLGLD